MWERILPTALGLVLTSAGLAKAFQRTRADKASRSVHSSTWWVVLSVLEAALGLNLVLTPSPPTLVASVAFLVAASAYLGLKLARHDREACNCWGVREVQETDRAPESVALRSALRPAWYFARNGGLVGFAATALEWTPVQAAVAVGAVWALLLGGTLVSIVRLSRTASREIVATT